MNHHGHRVVGAVAAIVLVGLMLFGGIGYWTYAAFIAKATVHNRVQVRVNGTDFAQQAYESFFNQCHTVLALNQQVRDSALTLTELEREAATPDPLGQKAVAVQQELTNIEGMRAQVANVAEQYNADSQKWTVGQFKAAGLPAQINPPYRISCGSGTYHGGL